MSGIDWADALAPGAPPAIVMPASDVAVGDAAADLRAARPDTIVRTVDAAECSTTPDFLRSLATALDFPEGDVNWNVVNERLYDMTWYPGADAYVLVLLNCERFESAASAPDLTILDRILTGIVEESTVDARELQPRLLVCQCTPSRLDRFLQLLHGYGLDWPAAPLS